MRRMQDDEKRMLQGLRSGKPFKMSFDRAETIVRKFRYHGLIDANEELTKKGRHVAAKLTPIVTEELPIHVESEIEPLEESDWD